MIRYLISLPFWLCAYAAWLIGTFFESIAKTIDPYHEFP